MAFILIAVSACGGGGESTAPPPAPAAASTLAYVVTECRAGLDFNGTVRQSLRVQQGDRAPITVVEEPTVNFYHGRQCNVLGRNRTGFSQGTTAVFQRLGVTPDGSRIVFEVTDDLGAVFPLSNTLSVEQKGIFVVQADGTGLRRLGAASALPIG